VFKVKVQIGFEQIFSLLLFVTSVTYLVYSLLSYYPSYINEMKRQMMLSEAYQISEILVNDCGHPANWYSLQTNQIKRIGLLNESLNKTNVISIAKSTRLNTICNSYYQTFKQLLDLKNDISIIIYIGNNVLVNCTRPIGERAAKVNRIVSFNNGSYGELIIWLY